MTNSSADDNDVRSWPIVGRDSRVDLTKYTVRIHGRDVIDYEKLKAENPTLYREIVADEAEMSRKHDAELEGGLAGPSTSFESVQSILAVDRPASAKYFYIPLFVSGAYPDKRDNQKTIVDLLTFMDKQRQDDAYASRVLPGQTLVDAVGYDLRKNFSYGGEFRIMRHHLYDSAQDRHGHFLPRLVVLVKVDRFPTDAIHPAGLQAQWNTDGAAYLLEYGFEIVLSS